MTKTIENIPTTIELSDYMRRRILACCKDDEPVGETLQRILAMGLYHVTYRATMAERKQLQERIGKSVMKGNLDNVQELVAQLRATYRS